MESDDVLNSPEADRRALMRRSMQERRFGERRSPERAEAGRRIVYVPDRRTMERRTFVSPTIQPA